MATARARQLRRDQTEEKKALWRAVKAGADFKFRRQHPVGRYFLEGHCLLGRLAVDLDGFQPRPGQVMGGPKLWPSPCAPAAVGEARRSAPLI